MTALLSLVLLTGNTNAEEGSMSCICREHNLNSVNTPEGTVTGGKLEGIFKVTNSTGKLYVNGDNGKSTCIILSKNKDKKVQI